VCFLSTSPNGAPQPTLLRSEWEIGGYKSSRVCGEQEGRPRRSSARIAPPGRAAGRPSSASRMRGGRSRPPWAGSPWAGTRGSPARGHRGGWGRGRGQGGWEVGWGASWGHEWRGHRGKRGAEVSGCCGCGCGCGRGGWQSPAGRPTHCEVGAHRSADRDPLSPQVRTPHVAPAAHRAFRGAGHAAPRGAAPGRFSGRKLVRVGGFLVNPAGRPPPSVSTAHTSSSRALVRRATHRDAAPQARGTRSSSRPLAAASFAARRAPRAGAAARAAAAAAAGRAPPARCRCAAGRGASNAAPLRAAGRAGGYRLGRARARARARARGVSSTPSSTAAQWPAPRTGTPQPRPRSAAPLDARAHTHAHTRTRTHANTHTHARTSTHA